MTPERCKEQKAMCDKEFVKRVWLLTTVIGVLAGVGGTIWGASAWQTKTEMRMLNTENRVATVEADLDDVRKANALIDSIWLKVRDNKK